MVFNQAMPLFSHFIIMETNMKPITVIFFTIASVAVSILLGNYYSMMHVERKTWIIITAIITGIFFVKYIADMFKPEEPGKTE